MSTLRQENREYFDGMIGRLDRILSEFLEAARSEGLDRADLQTLKHHADDLIGVGQAALEVVKPRLKTEGS